MSEAQTDPENLSRLLPPVFAFLGLRVGSMEPGKVTLEMDASERHWNQAGSVHGGILAALADAAMGLAYITSLEGPSPFATVDMSVTFLKKVAGGTLSATAGVVSSGRTLALVECELRDGQGVLAAKASSTCLRQGHRDPEVAP